MPIVVHREERGVVALVAGAVFLLELADAWAGNAADALYIGRFGAGGLGVQLAVSSALLVATLGIVGMLADRGDRTRFLMALAGAAATVLVAMRLALALWPGAPVAFLVLAKQVSAATDLAFWVLVADRFDPRQARRLLPLLAAAGGVGLVAGSFTTDAMLRLVGVGELFLAAAGACLLASVLVRAMPGIEATRRVADLAVGRTPFWRAVREGIDATRKSELARRLAWVVFVAGALGPVLYTILGGAAAARLGGEAEIAAFLGRFRGVTHLLTLVAQSLVMPLLLRHFGVGAVLVVAPVVAVASSALLAVRLDLVTAALAQGASRVVDAAVETPAEKLVQNLLSRDARGRIGAFLDGVAKRCGAVAGGAVVTVTIGWPRGVGVVALAVGAAWLLASLALWRRYPTLAVEELSQRRGPRPGGEPVDLGSVLQSASLRLRQDLAGDDEQRRAQAIAVLGRGHPSLAAVELVRAARESPAARGTLVRALDVLLVDACGRGEGAPEPLPRPASELLALFEGAAGAGARDRAACLSCFGRLADPALLLRERPRLEALAAADPAPAVRLAAHAILARLDEDLEGLDESLDEALGIAADTRLRRAVADVDRASGSSRQGASGDEALRVVALAELRAEAAAGAGRGGPRFEARLEALAAFARRAAGEPRAEAFDALAQALTIARRTASDGAAAPDRSPGAEAPGRSMAGRRRASPDDGSAAPDRKKLDSGLVGHVGSMGAVAEAAAEALASSLDAPSRAAAVRALAALADVALAPVLARVLTDRDDEVREAAAAGLAAMGPRALPVLLVAARFGTRAARDSALGVLRDLEALPSTLDDVIESELAELHQVSLRRAALPGEGEPGGDGRDGALDLLGDRLEERAREIARTLLLVLEVRVADRRVGETARRLLGAAEPRTRAQALEALDALLPRHLAKVVDVLDEAPHEVRAERAARALGVERPSAAEALRAELEGNDALSRTLAVHALGRGGRIHHRRVLRSVAEAQIDAADPARLLRRILAEPLEAREEEDVLSSVQAMLSLRALPLFAGLTPSHLSELAQAVTWHTHAAGEIIFREGEHPGGLVFVVSGRVEVTPREGGAASLGPGGSFGEGELFAAELAPASVTALERTRLGRLSRDDFERVAEDTPGLALAVCRVLYGQSAVNRTTHTPGPGRSGTS